MAVTSVLRADEAQDPARVTSAATAGAEGCEDMKVMDGTVEDPRVIWKQVTAVGSDQY